MREPTLPALLLSQFHAALAMLAECVERCPEDRWDGRGALAIGTMPFWEVAYHALCFVDCYLSPSNEAFEGEIASRGARFHPEGMRELSQEHPSRRFERDELRRYAAFCRDKAATVLAAETDASLAGPSGFSWLAMPRAEVHLYNLRHLAHHTGQLTAFLRRAGVQTKWCKAGWREPARE